MYGEAAREIQAVCKERALSLHVWPWRAECGRAGLRRDSVYLVRPDGYVALADPESRAARITDFLDTLEGDAEEARRTNRLTQVAAEVREHLQRTDLGSGLAHRRHALHVSERRVEAHAIDCRRHFKRATSHHRPERRDCV